MFSKPLAFVLLALASITAAAGGAYVAARHNAADSAAQAIAPAAAPAPAATPSSPQPVAETESPVSASKPETSKADATKPVDVPVAAPKAQPAPQPAPVHRTSTPIAKAKESSRPATSAPPAPRTAPARDGVTATQPDPVPAPAAAPAPAPEPSRPVEPQPEPPRAPQFDEVVLPASAVLGLQIETPVSSERARIEDRVEAHVTRDVLADGRVAIPAGSRVIGSVTLVDKGGKIKTPARLGIRFHTLVLGDGSEVALRTEPIYREGQSPTGDSAKKIGGAAVVGAILGGIVGGGKGAVIGGTVGGAGGTAAVMAGDRNPATIPQGATFNVRLSSPATIQVEKR
jgi:hypothetical protein